MRTIDADAIPWEVAYIGEFPVITKEEIDMMPTVEAEPKWIPVSERLPDYGEEVLVTTAWHDIVLMERWSSNQPNEWLWTSPQMRYDYEEEAVIAWMPLPKPYERQEE